MYAVHFQLVLCSGRQKFSGRCSVKTMKKERKGERISRLRVVPYFSSGIEEQAKRERA